MLFDLFQNPYVEPLRAEQIRLFHEPVSFHPVKRAPIVSSRASVDPANTLPITFESPITDHGDIEEMSCNQLRALAAHYGHVTDETKPRLYYMLLFRVGA